MNIFGLQDPKQHAASVDDTTEACQYCPKQWLFSKFKTKIDKAKCRGFWKVYSLVTLLSLSKNKSGHNTFAPEDPEDPLTKLCSNISRRLLLSVSTSGLRP